MKISLSKMKTWPLTIPEKAPHHLFIQSFQQICIALDAGVPGSEGVSTCVGFAFGGRGHKNHQTANQ